MPIASSLLNKPKLVKKLKDFYDYVNNNDGKVGTKTRGIDLNFNNACNLRCKYCFTNSPKGDHVKEYLDIDKIADLADQADDLGYFEFDLQGGELLLQPDKLFQVLEAIKPERFYLYLTTNGYYLDEKMAKELAKFKVSRVSVSIDSMDEKIHDEIRGRKDLGKSNRRPKTCSKKWNGSILKHNCRSLQCTHRSFETTFRLFKKSKLQNTFKRSCSCWHVAKYG